MKKPTKVLIGSLVLALGITNLVALQNINKLADEKFALVMKNEELEASNWVLTNSLDKVHTKLANTKANLIGVKADLKTANETLTVMKEDQKNYLDGKSYTVEKTLTIKASAYSQSDEEETGDGVTFTETKVANHRTVAVDPTQIPLGSLLYIESSSPLVGGFYVAEDIGGAIKGSRIDIFMSDRNQCFQFGKQDVKVTILKEVM